MRKIVPTILALIGTAAAVAILTVATVTRAPAPVTFTAPTVTTEAPTGDDLAFPTVDQVARYNGRTVTPSPGFDGRMLAPAAPGEPHVITTDDGLAVILADGTYYVIPWEDTDDCTVTPASIRPDVCELLTDY